MLNRVKLWRVWRQKQEKNSILSGDFPKCVFSVKRGVVHDDDRPHRQQRDQLKFEPILKKRGGRRVLVALQSDVLFAPQSADDICAFLPLAGLCVVDFDAPSRAGIKAAIFSV